MFEIQAGRMSSQGVWNFSKVVDTLTDWAEAVDVASKRAPLCEVNMPHYLVYSTTTGRFWDEGSEVKFVKGRAV